MNNWSRAAIIGWIVLAVIVIGYELWCVFGHDAQTPPLTDVTVSYLPWWITLPFLIWTLIHFAAHYALANGWTSRGFAEIFSR